MTFKILVASEKYVYVEKKTFYHSLHEKKVVITPKPNANKHKFNIQTAKYLFIQF